MNKYESDFDGRDAPSMVLEPKPFKPLVNIVTNNIFSYSFKLVEANNSANSEGNIRWVEDAPKQTQDKINKLRTLHQDMIALRNKTEMASKQNNISLIESLKVDIEELKLTTEEHIYPKKDRKFVESKEAKRQRLQQANELTLSQDAINAIRA